MKRMIKNYKKIVFSLTVVFLISFLVPTCSGDDVWSDPEIISKETSESSYRASLAIGLDDTIHIAWKDKTDYNGSGNDWDVFYRYKPINGNWSTIEVVSTENTSECSCLSLTVDNNDTVHIAWAARTDEINSLIDKIYYRSKTRNGVWGKISCVSNESTKDCACPSIEVDNKGIVYVVWNKGIVYVVWPDSTNYNNSGTDYDIFYKSKTENGQWGTPEVVSMESTNDSLVASLAIDNNGTVHVIWQEEIKGKNSDTNYDIFYKSKTENGQWGPLEVVSSESTSQSLSASIDIDNKGTIHVIWNDRTSISDSGTDYDIFYKFKTNDGIWSETQVISKESNTNCRWPSLNVDNINKVHVAWADQTNYQNAGNDYDIFYKSKKENGQWSSLEVISTESISDSNWPSFDIDSKGFVHMS